MGAARYLLGQLQPLLQAGSGPVSNLVHFQGVPKGDFTLGLSYPDPQAIYQGPRVPSEQSGQYQALREQGCLAREGFYWIPVGTARSSNRAPEPEQCVELTAIAPVRRQHDGGLAPLRSGWLYIFVEGRLWRELEAIASNRQVNGRTFSSFSRFREVNLMTLQGRDQRPAYALVDHAFVLVPSARPGGPAPKVQVAFSEVQWPWEYLCQMGGMADDDPRHSPQIKQRFADVAVDSALQNQRLQTLDIASYNGAPADPERDSIIPIQQALQQGSNVRRLVYLNQNHRDSQMPVVVVNDPLGEARELAGRYQSDMRAFAEWATENSHPHTVATFAEQLVSQDSDYQSELQYQAVERYLSEHRQTRKKKEQGLQQGAELLLACLQREEGDNSVTTAFSDFMLADAHAEPRYRHLGEQGAHCWATLIGMLADVVEGRDFLEQQLDDSASLTRQCLSVFDNLQLRDYAEPGDCEGDRQDVRTLGQARQDWKDSVQQAIKLGNLGYQALELLLTGLARPIADAEQRWNRIRPTLEKLYGTKITTQVLTYDEWRRSLRGNSGSQSTGNTLVSSAASTPANANHRVRVVTFDRVPVYAHRARASLTGLPSGIVNLAQVASLALAWADLAEKGLASPMNQAATIQACLDTLTTVHGLAQGSNGRLGIRLDARAVRIGMGTLGLVSNVIGVNEDLKKAADAMALGQEDLSRSYVTTAAGASIMAASGVFALLVIPGAGWLLGIGIVISLVGMYLLGQASKDDLAYWLRYGSFGRYPFGGNLSIKNSSHVFQKAASGWQAHPEQELQALYNLLFGFTAELKIRWYQSRSRIRSGEAPTPSVWLTVDMYNHDPDTSELEVALEVRNGLRGDPQVIMNTPDRFLIQGVSTRREAVPDGVTRFKFQVTSEDLPAGTRYALVKLSRREQAYQTITIPESRHLVLSVNLDNGQSRGGRGFASLTSEDSKSSLEA